MASSLGPILANIFLSHDQQNWLNKCPIKVKPSFYRRYIHQNMNFTVQKENVGSLTFLDVKICRKNGKFVTSVYWKPTFSGTHTNHESFIPTNQKRGPLHTLLQRSFSIFCDFKTFHFEIDHLNTILVKTNYPLNLKGACVKLFLNKLYTPKVWEMILLSHRSWEVLRFKFERSFKNYLVINWRLLI